MDAKGFPINPFREDLYTPEALLGEFETGDPKSFRRTLDFRLYRYFVKAGRFAPREYLDSMMQALHDNSVTQALQRRLASEKRVVAVMGGHKLPRGGGPYRQVVDISRRLARAGALVISGGGPGAMEAAHLGAYLAHAKDEAVEAAVTHLGRDETAAVPAAGNVVADDGTVDEEVADELHAWYTPAFEVMRDNERSAESVAVPTWHHGHEPPTPFASRLAKYFQNSIREDGLLAVAKHGIVYTEGKAGTLQEIFQDAAQNYYESFGWFSPMVLLGREYWTVTIPVVDALRKLFGDGPFEEHVLVTDSTGEAVEFLLAFEPPEA